MTKRKDKKKIHIDDKDKSSTQAATKDAEKLDLEQLREKLLRTQAEYANYQKRMARSSEEARIWTKAEIIKNFLPILDDMEQAIQAGENAKDIDSLLAGFKLVYQHMQDMLTRQQVEIIGTEDQRFDPAVHEAVMQAESADHKPGTVVAELRKGYTLDGRTLRPARVAVSKSVEAQPEPDQQEAPAEKNQDSQ